MDSILTNIIQQEKIEHVYQPIWNLNNWKIFGFEALMRFPDGFCDGNIEEAFEQARNEGCIYELDTMSILRVISSFPLDPLDGRLLFINLFPSTLVNEKFESFIEHVSLNYPEIKGKIVFELSETRHEEAIWKNPQLKKKISYLKDKGFFVALDDVGKGAATLRKIIEFAPNCIKLDRYFSKDLYASKDKQRMLTFLTHYSKNRMVVILEGIENAVDLAMAKVLNIPVAQGYLLGKPQRISEHSFIENYPSYFYNSQSNFLKR